MPWPDEDDRVLEYTDISGGVISAPSGYVGPGDIISGAFGWYGLRAYSGTVVGNKVIRIQRSSDSSQQDIVSLSTGSLNVGDPFFNGSTTYTILTFYDQSGNGNDLNSSTANPTLTLNAIGSLPGATFTRAATTAIKSTATVTQAQAFQSSFVAKRTATPGSFGDVGGSGTTNIQFGFGNSSGTVFLFSGNLTPTASATEGNFHAVQCLFNNASSELYVDGTGTTVSTATSTGFSAEVIVMGAAGNALDGVVCEMGFWPGTFTSGVKSSLNSNQHSYWGF